MTEANLSTLLRSLRETAPKLNRTTDDANRVIRLVEEFLTSLSIGIPAEVVLEEAERTAADADGNRTQFTHFLSLRYGKHGNAFRLLIQESDVHEQTDRRGFAEDREEILRTTPLTEAGRSDKLRAVAALPELLGEIVKEANRIEVEARKAVGTVNEIVTVFAAERTTPTDPIAAAHLKIKAELEKPNLKK